MSNKVVLTAKHCIDVPPLGHPVYAKMGSQRIKLKSPYALHPSLDIAVAELTSPMTMWNYNQGSPRTIPPKLVTSGYVRGIYPGTNQSLGGKVLLCFGFGGATDANPQSRLTYAAFNVTYGDGANPVNEPHLQRTNGAMCEGGDSGMMCLDNLSSYASRVAMISTWYAGGPPFDFCSGHGAADWAQWVWYLTAAVGP
jgi:hypothetical protein